MYTVKHTSVAFVVAFRQPQSSSFQLVYIQKHILLTVHIYMMTYEKKNSRRLSHVPNPPTSRKYISPAHHLHGKCRKVFYFLYEKVMERQLYGNFSLELIWWQNGGYKEKTVNITKYEYIRTDDYSVTQTLEKNWIKNFNEKKNC